MSIILNRLKNKKVLAIILTISIFAGMFFVFQNFIQTNERTYESHEPISVRNDQEFENLNLTGSGTTNDPYIIEGFRFSNNDRSPISIQNTSKHFVIRNNLFENGESLSAINFYDINSGVVTNNIIKNFYSSISVLQSTRISISFNFFINIDARGFILENVKYSTIKFNQINGNPQSEVDSKCIEGFNLSSMIITGNEFSNCYFGIDLANSDAISLSFNKINYADRAFHLYEISNSSFQYNIISNNHDIGRLMRSFQINFYQNLLSHNGFGLSVDNGLNLTGVNITQNTFSNHEYHALSLGFVENINVVGNYFENNRIGIGGNNVSYSEITDNEFQNNERTDISMERSYQNLISGNSFENSVIGIRFYISSNNFIIYNSIRDTNIGLTVFNSQNFVIYSNTITNGVGYDNIGIEFGQSTDLNYSNRITTNNTIRENTITNIDIGINIVDSVNNSVVNNYLSETNTGVSILSSLNAIHSFSQISRFNKVHSNEMVGNRQGIIFSDTHNNTLSNNLIENSETGIMGFISDYIKIISNSLINSDDDGVELREDSNNHTVMWNNFINSTIRDIGTNNEISHNYWNDWRTPDSESDGIVDVPYEIDEDENTTDEFPLTTQHSLNMTELKVQSQNGSLQVSWDPVSDSYGHEIFYQLSYSVNSEITWIDLMENNSTSFNWDPPTSVEESEIQFRLIVKSSSGLASYYYTSIDLTPQNSNENSNNSKFFLIIGLIAIPIVATSIYIVKNKIKF